MHSTGRWRDGGGTDWAMDLGRGVHPWPSPRPHNPIHVPYEFIHYIFIFIEYQ